MNIRTSQKGFTLIEILSVMALIGTLSFMALAQSRIMIASARTEATEKLAQRFVEAQAAYYKAYGSFALCPTNSSSSPCGPGTYSFCGGVGPNQLVALKLVDNSAFENKEVHICSSTKNYIEVIAKDSDDGVTIRRHYTIKPEKNKARFYTTNPSDGTTFTIGE